MTRPSPDLTVMLRSAAILLLTLLPFVAIAALLSALLGGPWLAYATVLLLGVALGSRLERVRARREPVPAETAPGEPVGPVSATHAREDEAVTKQKYLM